MNENLDLLNEIENKGKDTKTKSTSAKDHTAAKMWKECLKIIKDNVDTQSYRSFFATLTAKNFENGTLTIEVPSPFYKEWIDTNFNSLLFSTVKRVCGEEAVLRYEVVIAEGSDELAPITITQIAQEKNDRSPQKVSPEVAAQKSIESGLNPRYNFDNFVVGTSNQFAVNAAKSIVNDYDKVLYSPLFIYGGIGLGKTHIAQAIANAIIRKDINKRCLYVCSEQFASDYIEFVTSSDLRKTSFMNTYTKADVLIVDDIQFFAGKEKTQNQFFHIFNVLMQANKQIILTSDKAPKDIKSIDDRLLSRFIQGLNVEITKPDVAHRRAIIEQKSNADGLSLPDEVVDYIANNVSNSVREIEGVIIKLFAIRALQNTPVSLELTKKVVSGLTTEKSPITINEIKSKVGMFYNVKPALMESNSRKKDAAFARQVAMFFARNLTKLPLKVIGSHFGNRDHTTVLHSCRVIDGYLEVDKKIQSDYEILTDIFNNR